MSRRFIPDSCRLVAGAVLPALLGSTLVLGCKKDRAEDGAAPAPSASGASAASAATVAARPPPFAPDGVAKSASGVGTTVLAAGAGSDHPSKNDVVKVSFTGWGGVGDPFYACEEGEWFSFPLRTAIPGWVEGIQLMVPGETRRLWVPAQLTGAGSDVPRGAAQFPPGDLVFDIKLVEIVGAGKPPPAPDDVAGPPRSAKRTRSGVAYRLLSAATDPHAARPDPHGAVTLSYTAWTSKGELYDTTVPLLRTLPLTDVAPPLAEGLQRMRAGEKMRFWVPASRAGAGGTGPAHDALVYDVELVRVMR